MSTRDDVIAQAVFQQLLQSAKTLNLVEMALLKSAYGGYVQFHQLNESLRRKMRDIGLAAVTAAVNHK
ncbi:MAG: hypothetical protein ACSLEZ_15075 [Thiobacillus sp.]